MAWPEERARVLAAIEQLPADERAKLHALAALLKGIELSPGSALYVQNLVRVYKATARSVQ